MQYKASRIGLLVLLGFLSLLGACQPEPEPTETVTLIIDGDSREVVINQQTSVNDIIRSESLDLSPLDRVNPPGFSPIEDGLVITVVRVEEETIVVEEPIPFQSLTQTSDGLTDGESRLLQSGANGMAEVTYRILYENSEEVSRTELRRIEISPARDEVILVGSEVDLATVTVEGRLFYMTGGNIWVVEQNSANRRPLTIDGGLTQARIFEVNETGERILFSRPTLTEMDVTLGTEESPSLSEGEPTGEASINAGTAPAFNRLWVIFDTTEAEIQPVPLNLENILDAEWVPGSQASIVYSTAEPRSGFPGWQANNDLWLAQVTEDGRVVNRVELLAPSSGGVYGWFGTRFALSPDGTQIAWAQPDAAGVLQIVPSEINEDNNETVPTPTPAAPDRTITDSFSLEVGSYARQTLLSFSPFNPFDFVWLPALDWSKDSQALAVITHGPPLGNEAEEDSPVFNLTAFIVNGQYSVDLVERAGMWAAPQYAPANYEGEPLPQRLAYLQAIEPLNSVVSEYQLVIIDRDGSNPQRIFPEENTPGLEPQTFAWSADGEQLAIIYQSDLYIIDAITGLAQRLTGDGQSSNPRWVP